MRRAAQISSANTQSSPIGERASATPIAPSTTHASSSGVPSNTCVHAPSPPMRPTHAENARSKRATESSTTASIPAPGYWRTSAGFRANSA